MEQSGVLCALVVIDLQNDITKNHKEIIKKVNTATLAERLRNKQE